MSDNYQDGVNQAEFDRAHNEMDDECRRCSSCERMRYRDELISGKCEDCYDPAIDSDEEPR